MKNLLTLALSGILLLLAACNKNDDANPIPGAAREFSSANHFYGTCAPDLGLKGVTQQDNLWYPGSTIIVRLLNDPYNKAGEIKAYAAEWEKYAGITFRFVEEGAAHVRIGFDWNNERYITWSYTGTDCKIVTDQNEATMSFAFWDSSNEKDRKADVLRAFGQVLGLELEHRHLQFDPKWSSRIDDYWEGEIEDIPWESLKKYVFDPLEKENTIATDEYDEESIMIWPFHQKYATNTMRRFNYDLSASDIRFIRKLYPKEADAVITMKTGKSMMGFYVKGDGDAIIDWGDGKKSPIRLPDGQSYYNYYQDKGEHVIRLYGDKESVTHLDCWDMGITSLDVSNCINLESLVCGNSELATLDVSNNTGLKSLQCPNSRLTALDVSKNKDLMLLGVSYNPFVFDPPALADFVQSLPEKIIDPTTPSEKRASLFLDAHYGERYGEISWIIELIHEKGWYMVN